MSRSLHTFGHAWSEAPEVEYERRERQREAQAQYTPDITWGHTMRPRKAQRVNTFLVLLAFGWLTAAGLAVVFA